ncbi:PilZ domain-containing protein [Modestobacter excelsi]|uniref:PilZ domain-containing protein n=1 Tax=Modestobacter excelsi TaxID=2213161 RepID=UPI00110CC173|nr:PilZ domain-containing protein [Modestobacter excelsi]
MTRTGVAGTDYPEERAIIDVLVAGRDSALLSWVERLEDHDIVVTVGQDRAQRRVRVDDGERVELIWRAPTELRSMPAQLVATEDGTEKCWRVRPTGPAVRGQRRSAVRAPLSLEVRASAGSTRLTGTTVDISEGGFRGLLGAPAGAAETPTPETAVAGPQVGELLDVVVDLGPGQVDAKAEVIRRHEREDDLHELSARFIGLPERTQDQIRARVFAGLRDLRQRGLL